MLDDKVKKTLKYMIIGLGIYCFTLLVLSIIFFIIFYNIKNETEIVFKIMKNSLCVLIGFISSVVGLYSMATSLSKAVASNDPKYAKRHITIMSYTRLFVFCILLGVIISEKTFGLTGGILFALATLGVKIGTYLVPVIQKKFNKQEVVTKKKKK